jgi:hypothetical protein
MQVTHQGGPRVPRHDLMGFPLRLLLRIPAQISRRCAGDWCPPGLLVRKKAASEIAGGDHSHGHHNDISGLNAGDFVDQRLQAQKNLAPSVASD